VIRLDRRQRTLFLVWSVMLLVVLPAVSYVLARFMGR